MAEAPKIRLVNGPFDGVEVEDTPSSDVLWVYKNMYGQAKAVAADTGVPRTPTMASYVVLPGRLEALHGSA